MILKGVAAFGAFVDTGIHRDGLVHVSVLSNTFVKDPHSVVKPQQKRRRSAFFVLQPNQAETFFAGSFSLIRADLPERSRR